MRPVLLAIPIALAAAGPAVANATPLRCGDVVTRDTRLTRDLVNCPGDGLIVGAPGITLNLNGHVIDGDGQEGGTGVNNAAGHDRVTISNGAVREFDFGVSLPNVTANRVDHLRVSHNAILGMDLDLAERSVIENSWFARNGEAFEGPGIFVVGSHDTRIEGNTAVRNGGAGLLQLDSDGSRIAGNAALSNAQDGLVVAGTGVNEVTRNLAVGSGIDGIVVEAPGTRVSRNEAHFNRELGIHALPGVIDGGGNRARANGNRAQCVNVSCR